MIRISANAHPWSAFSYLLLTAPLIPASACADDEDGESDGTMETESGTDSSSTSMTDGSNGIETTTSETNTSTDTDTNPNVARPDGWFPDSHEKGMPARLDIILPDAQVNELVLRITPETWDAIQADIADVTGELTDPTIPCIDKEMADMCDVNIPGLEGPGICHLWYGDLVCIPDIVSPCVDKEIGDACESPLMVPSICQESDGGVLCLPDQNPDGEVDPCYELAEGDACETALGAGTCSLNGEELACVLNPDVLAALLNPCASIPDSETCH